MSATNIEQVITENHKLCSCMHFFKEPVVEACTQRLMAAAGHLLASAVSTGNLTLC